MKEKILIFNPYYHIHHDITRTFLVNDNFLSIDETIAKAEFHAKIHPIHAMFLAFFDGKKSVEQLIPEISLFFNINDNEVLSKIESFYYNDEISIAYDQIHFRLPNNLLINKKDISRKTCYSSSDFFIKRENLDFEQPRFNKPTNFTIVINNICYTNCLYCYADKAKEVNNYIPITTYKRLIKEAYETGIKEIDITGGELFYHKYWFELLKELSEHNYYSYISTKVPLNEDQVLKLKSIGYNFIQLSLDSTDPATLSKLLDVKENYIDKIKKTLTHLQKNNFKVVIKAVLTNNNSSRKHLNDLMNFVNEFDNIENIQFAIMEYSINNKYEIFQQNKLSELELRDLEISMAELKSNFPNKEISIAGFSEKDEYVASKDDKTKSFEDRAFCSGNFSSFFVLPDGNVTLCEELYWREEMYLGNLMENSITEVWNSQKALDLFHLKDLFKDKDSTCKDCDALNECRINGAGVCWKEIIAAYGEDNIHFPDPKCPYAPKFEKEIYY